MTEEPTIPVSTPDAAPPSPPEPPKPSPPPPVKRRHAGSPLLLLTLLLALAAGGGFGWQWLRAQSEHIERLQLAQQNLDQRAARLQAQHHDMTERSAQTVAAIESFKQRLDQHDQAAGKLAEQVQGGRVRFQLAAVENLLLAANERVQLQQDVRGALTALGLADQRLAILAEPRLYKLREAIAQERAALMALPQPDLTSTALTLSSLIARVPQLPLRARVPERNAPQPQAEVSSADADGGWFARARHAALHALSSVFNLRRNDGPAPRLLPPEQEALVYQTLTLKLEGARMAMLRNDATSYRDLCASASAWLRVYFREQEPNVLAAQAELERLSAVPLGGLLPEVSGSLAMLRAYLDSAAP